jgi:polygalacturonase
LSRNNGTETWPDGIDPGCGSRGVHVHDVFIENGDDSIVMKPGWPTEAQRAADDVAAGCTRDVLVERITIYRGMGANIGGMGSGCVDNITFRHIVLDHPSLAGVEIKTENGKDNHSFISNINYENISFSKSLNASGFPCVSITASCKYLSDHHNSGNISSVFIRNTRAW